MILRTGISLHSAASTKTNATIKQLSLDMTHSDLKVLVEEIVLYFLLDGDR